MKEINFEANTYEEYKNIYEEQYFKIKQILIRKKKPILTWSVVKQPNISNNININSITWMLNNDNINKLEW